MLSYRHGFHAGNFADLLKHFVLVEILNYMAKKEKPFDYIDTHAGAGFYDLKNKHASHNQEYLNGIGHWFRKDGKKLPDLGNYLEFIRELNPDGLLRFYPGSPSLAGAFTRVEDKIWCFELHNNDFLSLKDYFGKQKNIHLRQEDGFKALPGLLPTQSRRALIMIDPSYEIKSDYQKVFESLNTAYSKMPTACFALWYPVTERERINKLERQIKQSKIKNVCLFELGIEKDKTEKGMSSAGMIIINPPFTLFSQMEKLLPELAQIITQDSVSHYRCEQLKKE